MQSMFWKTISIILLAGSLLSLPSNAPAGSEGQFPYQIDKTVNKEKTYNYASENVWETSLILIREMEATRVRDLKDKGIKSVKSSIKTDKSSGIISFSLTHKGNKGYFSDEDSLFYYQILLLKPLAEKRTRVYFHEINFYSYDQYVFHGKQLARYLDFKPSAINILESINTRLKEERIETQ